MAWRARFTVITVPIAVLACSAIARADDAGTRKFTEGTAASDRHDWTRAEALFAESIMLEPSIGAYFNRGYCLEQLERVNDAYASYRAAAALARTRDDPRERIAKEAAEKLLPKVHFVELEVPPSVASTIGAKVVVDGAEVPARGNAELIFSAKPVHEVTVTAPEYAPWTRTAIADHEHVRVELGTPRAAGTSGGDSHGPDSHAPAEGWSTSRYVAIGLAGAGAATLAVSGVFFLTSASHFGDLKQERDKACASPDTAACAADAAHVRQYRSDVATPATVLDVVGAVLVAGGVTLWFVGPQRTERSTALAPFMIRDAAGLSWSGAFQ